MPGARRGDDHQDARSELAYLRAEFNRVVKLRVDAPLRERGYRKKGLHWTKETDEICRFMGLHSARDRRALNLTIDTSVLIAGTEVFTRGEGRLGMPAGPSDESFVQPPSFGVTCREFCVDADGLAVGHFRSWDPEWRRVPSDGSDLELVVREQVLPYLEQFSTTADALAYGQGVIAHWRSLGRDPAALANVWSPLLVIEALAVWRKAGSPVASVTVSSVDDNRVRVEVDDPTSLVGSDDDLALACVERGTPHQFAWSVTEIERASDHVLIVRGRGLDPVALQTAYSAYLSVVRFASEVPDIGGVVPFRMPALPFPIPQLENLFQGKTSREPWFDVEVSEDGVLHFQFRDDIAHEDPGAIDDCAEAASGFSWVISAAHVDREVLRLEVRDHVPKDLRDLRTRFTSIVRERRRELPR